MHHDRLKHSTKIWGQGLKPSSVWCKRDKQKQITKMRMTVINMCISGRRRRERVAIWGIGHQSGTDFSRAFDLHWLFRDPENSSFCSSPSQFLLRMITQKMVNAVYSFVTFGLWLPEISCSITEHATRKALQWFPRGGDANSRVFVSLWGPGHQGLKESSGTHRPETCDGAPQRVKIIHNYFTSQWRKVFWRAPFH